MATAQFSTRSEAEQAITSSAAARRLTLMEVEDGWLVLGSDDDLASLSCPPGPQALISYAEAARYAIEISGITVNGIKVATDDRSKQMIMGARIAAQANAAFTTPWVGADGAIVELDAAQVVAISDAVLAHVQQCFVVFADIVAGLSATPQTITTTAEIDAAFAAVTA